MRTKNQAKSLPQKGIKGTLLKKRKKGGDCLRQIIYFIEYQLYTLFAWWLRSHRLPADDELMSDFPTTEQEQAPQKGIKRYII